LAAAAESHQPMFIDNLESDQRNSKLPPRRSNNPSSPSILRCPYLSPMQTEEIPIIVGPLLSTRTGDTHLRCTRQNWLAWWLQFEIAAENGAPAEHQQGFLHILRYLLTGLRKAKNDSRQAQRWKGIERYPCGSRISPP